MPPPPPSAAQDYSRNLAEYGDFWSQRRRRTWTYASQTKLKRFRALMRKMGFLPRSLDVFDHGFGMGLMLFCFGTECSLAGVEITPAAVEGARKEALRRGYRSIDFRVFAPDSAMPADWHGRFDLVISSHALEHIAEPMPVLRDLAVMVKPGGHLCILVPVNESPGEDLNHFHNFTWRGVEGMVTGLGFGLVHTEECDRLYHALKPVALARQRRDTLALKLLSKFLNAVLAPIPYPGLRLADSVLAWFGIRNTQCIVLARKPCS